MIKPIKITGTTPETYISGYYALNIAAPEGTSGDWHFPNYFYKENGVAGKRMLWGEGQEKEFNTNHIFDDYGIHECSKFFSNGDFFVKGLCFSANHFRAILDLAYQRLITVNELRTFRCATNDYLDTEKEVEFVLLKAELMLPFLSVVQQNVLKEWIEHEKKI